MALMRLSTKESAMLVFSQHSAFIKTLLAPFSSILVRGFPIRLNFVILLIPTVITLLSVSWIPTVIHIRYA
jgi:hypothetical protein